MLKEELAEILSKAKLLVCDFDGVLTNGTVTQDENGIESVQCSRKDGLGINLLQRHGIEVIVISKETNPVVAKRCQKMKIGCIQAVESSEGKAEILERLMKERGLDRSQVAFMGDDLNDIPAMKLAGVAITVADGHRANKAIAHYTTVAGGGQHAVREVAELILEAKGILMIQF